MYHIVTRKDPPEIPAVPVPPTPPTPPSMEDRKERVIHTRVPESLEAELREGPQGLGISVPNLVRHGLGHAFGLVGDVVADGHAFARPGRSDHNAKAKAAPPPDLAEVL